MVDGLVSLNVLDESRVVAGRSKAERKMLGMVVDESEVEVGCKQGGVVDVGTAQVKLPEATLSLSSLIFTALLVW